MALGDSDRLFAEMLSLRKSVRELGDKVSAFADFEEKVDYVVEDRVSEIRLIAYLSLLFSGILLFLVLGGLARAF
jgi:hypothetical protein